MAATARGDGVLSEGSQLLWGLNQDGSSEIEPIYGPGVGWRPLPSRGSLPSSFF